MTVGVLLAGSGVYDGSEIHEATFTLLALEQNGFEYVCFAPDKKQHHVINHLTGEEMDESRNVLVESARIARGNIQSISKVKLKMLDGLVIPGGFGPAKNITSWAFDGPSGEIDEDSKRVIVDMVAEGKPVAALCMSPTVIAKAFEGTGLQLSLTVGTVDEPSPYDIQEVADGMDSIGAKAEMKTINEICIDEDNKIITAPCYMMDATIEEVYNNAKMAVDKLCEMVKENNE